MAELYEEEMKKYFPKLFENGYSYEYAYDKGSDSSCVYIYRFKKGKDRIELREVSGSKDPLSVSFVLFLGGEYIFPALSYTYKKEYRKFFFLHIFRKATYDEKWSFISQIALKELEKLAVI